MSNINESGNGSVQSSEENIQYQTGKTETKTIKAKGEVNKITASVAIDGQLSDDVVRNVQQMVANTIGMDPKRGDNVKVVSMGFEAEKEDTSTFGVIKSAISKNKSVSSVLTITGIIIAIIIGLLICTVVYMIMKNRRKSTIVKNASEEDELELINKKLEELEQNRLNSNEDEDEECVSLEDEVKQFAANNPDQVTDLVNSWLNE